ncbi:class I SAM-dependent RNA methyltransferase [Jatrophihabitans sp. YIM 134969]
MSTATSLAGARLRLRVGAVAHGGHCVARIDDASGAPAEHVGRVVFVRHTLPGELVTATVTEDDGGSFLRADAVAIAEPAAGRVDPPCPFSGPGRCGGCDWQHADAATQLELKTAVVREALQRFAGDALEGLDLDVTVEPLDGGLLYWRTRTTYAVDRSAQPARLGLRRHRSHDVEPVTMCPISAPGVGDAPSVRFDPTTLPAGATGVEYVLGDSGTVSTVVHRPAPTRAPADRRNRPGRGNRRHRRPPDVTEVTDGPATVWHAVAGRSFRVAAPGFWQGHPLAASTFAAAVVDGLGPCPGERALDLYAGAGLFTGVLADLVGADGGVLGLEADAGAVTDAGGNLTDVPWAFVRPRRVDPATVAQAAADLGGVDLVVLDPPRSGAGPAVAEAIAATSPRAVTYVACDPVALARDLAAFARHGYRPTAFRAYDAFPMTHHVECVVTLAPAGES